ncbi:MAG TPA: hypothetical protein VE992_03900 [Solirubrobacteraceae bacterium]|nr:hypothetical protein [Solirubrobacteraceae bacterium]
MARKTARVGLLIAALAVLSPAPAVADEALWPQGAITYSWHGDPARGCAQVGVCGVQGALVLRPDDEVDLSGGTLELIDTPATIRVRRTDPGSSGDCIDSPGDVPLIALTAGRHGAVRASLGGVASSGRCAGPTAADLAPLALTGTRTRGRHASFDLRSSLPFTAGPYSGTLTSTLVLKPYHPQSLGGFFGGSSTCCSAGGPRPHSVLVEQVDLRYRVALPASAVTVSFAGQSGPFCAVLDACGAVGTLRLGLSATRGTLDIMATRRVASRLPRRRLLAELRAGRLVLEGGLGPSLAQNEVLSETLTRPGAQDCSDTQALPGAVLLNAGPLLVPIAGPRVPFALSTAGGPESGAGIDVLRTHCAGPSASDVFGSLPGPVLMRGSLATARLLAAHSTLTLSGARTFAGPGYSGRRSGSAVISLSLVHIGVRTVRIREGS